ncbi:hypothetical protein TSMEX_009791 [Taenia solium]|eukprot:TsM_000574300 transcript=TsM_000574300 gene=TsM_000574300
MPEDQVQFGTFPERLKLISPILSRAENLPCLEKETLVHKICRHLNASAHGIICAVKCSQDDCKASYPPQILPVFDILASVLRIQCPSRTNELHDICFFVRAVVDFLRCRECLESALGFILALCKCSGGSFSWMSQLTSETPDSLPVLLFLVTIEVELKLRLPTYLEGYLEINSADVSVAQICLELLSLLIAEIAEAGRESANNVGDNIMASFSDETLSSILKRLIGLGGLMATSLAPEDNSAPPDTPPDPTSSKTIYPTPLALHVLAVYLQWSQYVYKNRFLAVGSKNECIAAFDETLFQPTYSSASNLYDTLARSFETDVWNPLQPLMRIVIPEAFRPTHPTGTSKSLTLCRKLILRLARLFPAVVVNSLDTGFILSLLVDRSTGGVALLKSPMGMSYLRDICNLLETSQICYEINDSKESNASIDVIGRLTSVLGLAAAGSTILDHFNAEVNGQCCDRCKIAAQAQLAGGFCDIMVMLRTLVVNAWLIEFALRLGPSRLFDPVVPVVPGEEETYVSTWISEAALTVLRKLVKLEPSSFLDWNFYYHQDHTLRGFYTPCTLRNSAEAVLQCCRNNCSYSSAFRAAWQCSTTPSRQLLLLEILQAQAPHERHHFEGAQRWVLDCAIGIGVDEALQRAISGDGDDGGANRGVSVESGVSVTGSRALCVVTTQLHIHCSGITQCVGNRTQICNRRPIIVLHLYPI